MLDHAGLGAYLRQSRETRGLTLDDLSQATRIAPRYLHALEHGRLVSLPAPVFVRGYIRAYCASVGEPATHALRLYETARAAAAPPPPPTPAAAPVFSRRAALPALIVVVGLLVLAGALYLVVSPSGAGSGSSEPEASR